jgi:hypothetical protein
MDRGTAQPDLTNQDSGPRCCCGQHAHLSASQNDPACLTHQRMAGPLGQEERGPIQSGAPGLDAQFQTQIPHPLTKGGVISLRISWAFSE